MGITAEQELRRCHRCGEPLAGAELSGNCPRCLTALLLSPETPEPVEAAPTTVLRRLGDYELLEEVARGGMGVVFRARQVSLGREVAVKVLRDAWLATPVQVKRFRAEAANAAKLKHPNIVAVHEVGEQGGQHYFAMDLVKGLNLAEATREGPLPPRRAAELVAKVAEAVQHAHQQGVLHRDLKPSNVLLDAQGEPQVTDFGLARPMDDESSLTLTGQILGTPGYIAPEQAKGGGAAGPAADVYGLGALLFHLLTGRAPFVGASTAETLTQVLQQEPLSPRLLNRAVPVDLAAVCLKCLRKAPRERYGSAGELAADLERFLANETTQARPAGPMERAVRWCRRKPVVAGLGATMILFLLVIVIGSPIAIWRINVSRVQEEVQRKRAEAARDTLRRNTYVAEMGVGFQALAENNLGRARELLDRQRPKAGEEDLRGFEWRHLWQLCQGDELAAFDDVGAAAAVFSPDAKLFAYAGERIIVREAGSRKVVATLPSPATSLSFAPHAELLASANESSVRIWDTRSWREVRSLPDTMHVSQFSPDGCWLVTGAAGGFRVWDTRTWKPAGDCSGAPLMTWYWRNGVAFSPDSQFLITLAQESFPAGDHFRVWRLPGLERLPDLRSGAAEPCSAAFTKDGKQVVAGLWDGQLLVWDFATRKVVTIRRGHTALSTAVAVAADGKTFATASCDRTIIQWDAITLEILARRRGHLGEVQSLAISADGRMMVSGSVDKTTRLWRTDLRPAGTTLDGPSLVAGFIEGGRKLVGFMTNSLCVWAPGTGARVDFPVPPSAPLLLADIWGIPYDVKPNEPLCVRGREDGTVEVWSLANGTETAHWSAHADSVCAAVFSPDGERLATGSKTGEVKIWDFATRRELARQGPVRGQVNCLAFSPDGRALAAVANSTRVWLWDMNTVQEIQLDGQDIEAYAVAFSPDGKLLAATTGSSNEIHLWDLPSKRHIAVLKSHVMGINSVAFSPDGKTLATGSTDRRVKLWNVATRQEVVTLSPGITAPMVSFSPDGRILGISDLSSAGRQIQILRALSFEEIAQKEQAGKWKGEGEP